MIEDLIRLEIVTIVVFDQELGRRAGERVQQRRQPISDEILEAMALASRRLDRGHFMKFLALVLELNSLTIGCRIINLLF